MNKNVDHVLKCIGGGAKRLGKTLSTALRPRASWTSMDDHDIPERNVSHAIARAMERRGYSVLFEPRAGTSRRRIDIVGVRRSRNREIVAIETKMAYSRPKVMASDVKKLCRHMRSVCGLLQCSTAGAIGAVVASIWIAGKPSQRKKRTELVHTFRSGLKDGSLPGGAELVKALKGMRYKSDATRSCAWPFDGSEGPTDEQWIVYVVFECRRPLAKKKE